MNTRVKTAGLALAGLMLVFSFASAVMYQWQMYQLRSAFGAMGAGMAEASKRLGEYREDIEARRVKTEREQERASERHVAATLDAQRIIAAREEQLRQAEGQATARAVREAAELPTAAQRPRRTRAETVEPTTGGCDPNDPLCGTGSVPAVELTPRRGRVSTEVLDSWN